jgi:hypothetical protein
MTNGVQGDYQDDEKYRGGFSRWRNGVQEDY